MEIGKKHPRPLVRLWGWLLALLLVFGTGLWLGHSGILTLLGQEWANSVQELQTSQTGDLPTLIVDMPFANYDTILDQRQTALAQGVFIGGEADFVPATIQLSGVTVPVRMRLQQGTAVSPHDNKWNFEVRTRDDRLLLDMQRFQLIDPADNNWLQEWAFTEVLRREGLLAARYHFVNLQFNGDQWGIYAVQEGFGPELALSQGRPDGVMVEFDATRLWQSVVYFAGDEAIALHDPVTNLTAADFQFFEVDTFRDATIAQNDRLRAQKDAAIGLLRGLQAGDLPASQVFDVTQYGRFLALTDLWGALRGISLTNLRYYYDPESGRLEPIGFNGNPLASTERLPLTATYYDPEIQAAYVQAALTFTQPDSLAQWQTDLTPQLEILQQAIHPQVTAVLPWEMLAQRQTWLRQSLQPLQPVFAYLGPPELAADGVIQIDVTNVLNLPLEIVGFDIGGATFLEPDQVQVINATGSDPFLLAAVDPETAVSRYSRFHLPLTTIVAQDSELDFHQEVEIQVATRILGHHQVQLTAARPGYSE